jgi:glyoxylase-like metal-dependent hydrolase (beta-lactamase superfamily II)
MLRRMKQAHRQDLFVWSHFDESRNIDFHSLAWTRPDGNVLIDPLPMSEHDLAHLQSLGGAAHIAITNSDHIRDARALAERFGAELCGPLAERETLALPCQRWLDDGDSIVPGLRAFALDGSKTPGELALVLDDTTLITGDLVRCQRMGQLNLLPAAKMVDEARARASLVRLVDRCPKIETVLVGDGWPLLHGALAQLRALSQASG